MNFDILKTSFKDRYYNILDYGAKCEYGFNNQKAIQMAIVDCNLKGGGYVIIPNGLFITGPIKLLSNVCLKLEYNSYLKFNKDKNLYPLEYQKDKGSKKIKCISPIAIDNEENVGIIGNGTIDGDGDYWRYAKRFKFTDDEWSRLLNYSNNYIKTDEGEYWFPNKNYKDAFVGEKEFDFSSDISKYQDYFEFFRPNLINIRSTSKILLKDITIKNPPAFNLLLTYCDNVIIDNIKVLSNDSAQNSDAIDISLCENVEVKNCFVSCGDDGICLKSGTKTDGRKDKYTLKNIYIHDCKVAYAHGGFVIGSETSGDLSNVYVSNLTFFRTEKGIRIKSAPGRGGDVSNIHIENINMDQIQEEAIFLDMSYNSTDNYGRKVKADNKDAIIKFHDIDISNVISLNSKIGIHINGVSNDSIYNINFKDVTLVCDKAINIKNCKNINYKNVKILTKDENIIYE